MGEKYYLGYENGEALEEIRIAEPGSADRASYNLKQEDKKLRRDVLFSDGEVELVFYKRRRHTLRKLLFTRSRYGTEAKVYLKVVDGLDELKLDLDFKSSSTDGVNYFKCKLIQDANIQIIKRRLNVKVNVMSPLDCDKNPIDALVPQKFLLKAHPTVQRSKWETKEVSKSFQSYGGDGAILPMFTNLIDFEIENSYAPFSDFYDLPHNISEGELQTIRDEITLIRAATALSNITVNIKGVNLLVSTSGFYVNTEIRLNFGTSQVSGEYTSHVLFSSTAHDINIVNQDYTYTIPEVPNGGFVWLAVTIAQPFTTGGATPVSSTFVQYSAASLDMDLTSTAYNTITYGFRLYDVIKYVIKSISGLDIIAPRYAPGGEFYDQFLVTGNFLRGLLDKGFTITLKQIEDIILEQLADYEAQPDNLIFFGTYPDYYRDEEIAVFTNAQFDKFNKTFNPKFSINQVNVGFKSFQSQKEITVQNSADGVHGSSEWINSYRNVENLRDLQFEAIRDAILIETMRRKALLESSSTATQDDTKLAIIDVYTAGVATNEFLTFTESSLLLHHFDDSTLYLTLKNDGSFSWLLLGLEPGSLFTIGEFGVTSPNSGVYTVVSVTPNAIVLVGGGDQDFFSGETFTFFTYNIPTAGLEGVNWTNEGFTSITGIANGNNYANLRFTKKWIIKKFHDQYLASANVYAEGRPFTKTEYLNNPDATTTYGGETVVEGADFVPKNPILSAEMFEDIVYTTSFAYFIKLQNDIRTKRGYIRAIDAEGFVIRFYAKTLSYEKAKRALTIKEGEEKYQPVMVNIVKINDFQIEINEEYDVSRLKYEVIDDEIKLKDNEDRALYNPIFWNKIAVNGVVASSINELKSWLLLLS